MFDCTCNTQNSLLLNQHYGDDAPQQEKHWGHTTHQIRQDGTAIISQNDPINCTISHKNQ